MKRCAIIALMLAIVVTGAFAEKFSVNTANTLTDGTEELVVNGVVPGFTPNAELNEIMGDTAFVGFTMYDTQHNATVGRMINVADDGEVTIVWMHSSNDGHDPRHIKLNRASWDNGPVLGNQTGGWTVDSGARAGYTVLPGTAAGVSTPAYHSTDVSGGAWLSTLAGELGLIPGVFSEHDLSDNYPNTNEYIWPRAAMAEVDGDNIAHVILNESREDGADEMRLLYYRVQYDPTSNTFTDLNTPNGDPYLLSDHEMNIAADIAVSDNGSRVGVATTVSRDYTVLNDPENATQHNNDMWLYLSEDGGMNWADPINLTNFIQPDLSLLPDTTLADKDTLRCYTDANVYFDHNDVCHVAFSVKTYWSLEGLISYQAKLFHWDELNEKVIQCGDGYYWNGRGLGAWQTMVERPSMYQDPESGILYMAFTQFAAAGDTFDVSDNGLQNSEVMMTATPPGDYYGLMWAEPINLTNTKWTDPDNGAAAGDAASEREPSLALNNPGDYLNLTYVLDLHAGSVVQEDDASEATNNPVVWHRVLKQDVVDAFEAWLPNFPLHVEYADPDDYWTDPLDYEWDANNGTDFNGRNMAVRESRSELPKNFDLQQNYPNPFNPTTNIAFALDARSQVKLAVYDVLGREVATLVNKGMNAGSYEVTFDATDFASGVYFYRLESAGQTITRKMVLMK